jgi:hypothetical protein
MRKSYSLVLLALILVLPLTACAVTGRAKEKVTEKREAAGQVLEPTPTEVLVDTESAPTVAPEAKAEEDEQATATPAVATAAAPTQAVEEPTSAVDEPATGPAGGLMSNPEEALDSFRQRTTMQTQLEDGSWAPEITMETAWVREPEPARHMVMSGPSGLGDIETITIGQKQWTKMGEMWVMSEAEEELPQGGLPSDWEQLMREAQEATEGGMVLVGEETVNGVACKHYTVDASITIPFPVPADADEEALEMVPTEATVHQKGDMWVADQRDLPQVVIRSQTEAQMVLKRASGDMTTIMKQEMELYDINEPITIEPPSDEEMGAGASEYPMMEDAQIEMATQAMTVYSTASSVEDVVAFYEAEFPAAGWVQEGSTNLMMGMAMMQFTKEDASLTVNIQPGEEDETQVMLMTTP